MRGKGGRVGVGNMIRNYYKRAATGYFFQPGYSYGIKNPEIKSYEKKNDVYTHLVCPAFAAD